METGAPGRGKHIHMCVCAGMPTMPTLLTIGVWLGVCAHCAGLGMVPFFEVSYVPSWLSADNCTTPLSLHAGYSAFQHHISCLMGYFRLPGVLFHAHGQST